MHALRLHPIVETRNRDRQNKFDLTMFRYQVYFPFIAADCWGEECRSLYRGLRYIEVRYIEVLL